MTSALLLVVGLLVVAVLALRRRWLNAEIAAKSALRSYTNEKARCENVEKQINGWIIRTHAAESKLEELWMQDCEDRARERDAATGGVHLTDEQAHRVLQILFPERQRASGGKPS